MRLVDSADEKLIALWITFDRSKVFSKHGHTAAVENDKATAGDLSPVIEGQAMELAHTPEGVDPTNIIASTPPTAATPPLSMRKYSALNLGSPQSIDDFVILHSLGQGAYGHVDLAYNKNTPNKASSSPFLKFQKLAMSPLLTL
jgi:hypothetical protein